jgi:hypothetical protein
MPGVKTDEKNFGNEFSLAECFFNPDFSTPTKFPKFLWAPISDYISQNDTIKKSNKFSVKLHNYQNKE